MAAIYQNTNTTGSPKVALLPPPDNDPRYSVFTNAFGRSYSGAPGNVYLVPFDDGLQFPEQWTVIGRSSAPPRCGATSERPAFGDARYAGGPIPRGVMFLDLTVGKIIAWDGATWRDPGTGATV